MRETTIKKIALQLRNLKETSESHRGILFLGAGASRSAGIPLAGEIMEFIETDIRYKDFVDGCSERSYASYMNELTPGTRKKLLNNYISKAQVNQTHLYAAMLVKAGYIDTVVTVNFDPLMLRALAMVNIFPSVYDMAASKDFILGGIDFPAVVYLHGQSHGFWQLNTDTELPLALTNINTLFKQIAGTRTWICLGYSGVDPVLNQLANIEKFEQGLYWVGYKDNEPIQKVQELILNKQNSSAWYVKGYTSDEFMRLLKNELKIDEPNIINKPFTHLEELVKEIADFEIIDKKEKWTKQILIWIKSAREGFEEQMGFANIKAAQIEEIKEVSTLLKLKKFFEEGNYAQAIKLNDQVLNENNNESIQYLSYAYNNKGVELYNLVHKNEKDEKSLYEAIKFYKKAIELNSNNEAPYNNLGSALNMLSKIRNNDENIFNNSIEYYKKAIEINPDYFVAYYNLGGAMHDMAKAKNNNKTFFEQSIGYYEKSIQIDPTNATSYLAIGNVYSDLSEPEDKDENLLLKAIDYYKKAIQLKPEFPDAHVNLANIQIRLVINRGKHESILFDAINGLKKALSLEPNQRKAFTNLGNAFFALARNNDKSHGYLDEAIYNYKKELEFDINHYSSYYNLACIYSLKNDAKSALEWLDMALSKGYKNFSHMYVDNDLEFIRKLPEFDLIIEKYK